jgi:hypothetical protein
VRTDGYTTTERLELFLRRVNELLDKEAVRSGSLSISLSLSFRPGQGLTASSKEPSEESLSSFLNTFRQFVSDGEPIFVNLIANVLLRELDSDELRGHLLAARKRWLESARAGPLRLVIDEDHITPADALDLWINGEYFHNDKRQRERLQRLDPVGLLLTRHVFLNHIITATNYVGLLGQTVIVGHRQGLLN